MSGFKKFTATKYNHIHISEVAEAIKGHVRHAQALFYYHEDDQLKQKDERGWNAVEYFEHFNLMLYHQIDVMKIAITSPKGVYFPEMFSSFFHAIFYPDLIKKSKTNFFYDTFTPVSITNPGVLLNSQKVFQDLIYGTEQVIELLETEKVNRKIIFDQKIPGFLTIKTKVVFLSDYMADVVRRCAELVR